MQYQVEKHQAD